MKSACFGLAALALNVANAQPGALWPIPREAYCTDAASYINSRNVQFQYSGESSIVGAAIARYQHMIFETETHQWQELELEGPEGRRSSFVVQIKVDDSSSTLPTLDMDESYNLEVRAGRAVISAPGVFGALRGLETFSQLVWFEVEKESEEQLMNHTRAGGRFKVAQECSIKDSPRFPHRGVLVDTSRNFLSVSDLKRTVDGLQANKMNVLHWHMVDSQAFPFVAASAPQLAGTGAYPGPAGALQLYTPADVAEVVAYATAAGVRVIPEFDSPGHCWAGWTGWAPGAAKGGISEEEEMTVCGGHTPWTEACAEPPCGQLNPLSDSVYKVLDGLWGDVTDLFPSREVHMGGDEVNFACWNTSAAIRQHLADRGLDIADAASFVQLWDDFMSRAVPMLTGRGRDVTVWEESFTNGLTLPQSAIVHVWVSKASVAAASAAGHRVVLSDYEHMYLDCGAGNWITGGNSWCDPYKSWQMIYNNDPLDMSGLPADPSTGLPVPPLTAEQAALVLGGEAALFGEMVDGTVLDSKLWPRAAAAGERLWSYGNVTGVAELSWQEAQPRLMQQRERLVRRGVKAGPLMPRWCLLNPEGCPWPAV